MNDSNLTDCVVVIDDCPELCATLEYLVRDAGHAVYTAEDGRAGLREVRRRRPSVVLLDLVMPYMSGYEVLDAIRADPSLEGVTVIVLTGLAEDPEELREIASRADVCLGKPVDTVRLLLELDHAFASKNRGSGLLGRLQARRAGCDRASGR